MRGRLPRHAQDARPLAHRLAVLAHHLLVGDVLGPAGVQHLARRFVDEGHAHHVLEQVLQRDRRRLRLHPLRRHHQRQVVHQVADHLVGRRAGANDDAGPDLGDGHRAAAQPLAGVAARHQVLGVGLVGHQAAQVDDAAHAGSGRGGSEVLGGLQVQAAEVAPGGHRVHQVPGGVDALERSTQRRRLQRVGLDELGTGPIARLQHLQVARRRPHREAFARQTGHQVAAHVPGGAEDEHTPRRRRTRVADGFGRRCGHCCIVLAGGGDSAPRYRSGQTPSE